MISASAPTPSRRKEGVPKSIASSSRHLAADDRARSATGGNRKSFAGDDLKGQTSRCGCGCQRFGFRLVHFSVQGNHAHFIVEAPDAEALGRAMKGLEVRMARALNKVMGRQGPVFADRYNAHLLAAPREADNAGRYVLENWKVHAAREGQPAPSGVDPFCSAACLACGPPLVAEPLWWLLRVGVQKIPERAPAA
jgi:REP element-mobilizing transposase RayT